MTERLGRLVHLAARASLLGTGDGDSLQNVNTTLLNDGCLCYVTEFQAYYVFLRNSTDDAVGNVIVAPASGPGRWFFFSGPTDSESWAQITEIVTPLALTIGTQSQWENPPAPAGTNYSLSSPGPGLFTLDATTGLLTYTGPARFYEVSIIAAVANGAAGNAISIEVCPDIGVLAGTTNDDFAAGRSITPAAQDSEVCISSSKILALDDADVIRPVFRNLTNTDDLSIERLSWIIKPVS